MQTLSLYFKLVGSRIASQMQYPMSFFMSVLLTFMSSFIDVVGIWLVFSRFKAIDGWSIVEICLLYGLIHMSFALVEMFARGFDTFGRIVRLGQLDRILVRPRSIVLQVLGWEFRTANIGRFLQGLLPFIYAVIHLQIDTWWQWLAITIGLISSGMLFFSLLMVQATLSFWAQDSLEVMNAFVYGGIQAGQLPMSIYDKWLMRFFTFMVPIAMCSYYPILMVLGRPDTALSLSVPTMVFFSPIWTGCLVVGAHLFFRFGIRTYTSTG